MVGQRRWDSDGDVVDEEEELLLAKSLLAVNVSYNSATMASPKKLRLKLLVDKEKKGVVFAESDKDFIDILFSFLTMPIGAIIRMLNKQSSLGCMDKLYESIENLNDVYFNTEACKVMLRNPLNACRSHYTDLVLRIDDSEPQSFYTCWNKYCRTKSFPFFSSVPKARCGCGEIMDSAIQNVFEKLAIKDWGSLEETAIDLDVDKALNLLKACLTSLNPLTDIFLPKKQGRRKH